MTGKLYFYPSNAFQNPNGPTSAELLLGVDLSYAFTTNEGGNMARISEGDFIGEARTVTTIRVEDLFAVYPELEDSDETEQEFATKIARAATLARQEEAHDDLRGRLDEVFQHGYIHGVADADEEGDVNE